MKDSGMQSHFKLVLWILLNQSSSLFLSLSDCNWTNPGFLKAILDCFIGYCFPALTNKFQSFQDVHFQFGGICRKQFHFNHTFLDQAFSAMLLKRSDDTYIQFTSTISLAKKLTWHFNDFWSQDVKGVNQSAVIFLCFSFASLHLTLLYTP